MKKIIISVVVLLGLAGSFGAQAQELTADQAFADPGTLEQVDVAAILDVPVISASMAPIQLKATLLDDPLADSFLMRFSWNQEDLSYQQTAYQVLISSVGNYADDNVGDVWDSGKVKSEESQITVSESQTFRRMLPQGKYFWKVRTWNSDDAVSGYAPAQELFFVRKEGIGVQDGAPATPVVKSGVAVSANAIRWEFEDRATDETGFALFDDRGTVSVTTAPAPVNNYSYLLESGLLPNTYYSGRSVRTFNARGFSAASDTYQGVFTRANVPGMPTVTLLADGKIRIGIDPNKNPLNTEYALFDVASGSYLSAESVRVGTPDWRTLDSWQQLMLPVTGGPYRFAVQARNGDHIPTPFSPSVAYTTTQDSALELNLSATVYHGGRVLGTAVSAGGTLVQRAARALKTAGPAAGIALFCTGFFALAFLVSRRERGIHASVPTFVRLLHTDSEEVFDTHMDTRYISPAHFTFVHQLARMSLGIALALGIVYGAIVLSPSVLHAQEAAPTALSKDVRPGDVIEYQLDVRNTGAASATRLTLSTLIPVQAEFVDQSLLFSKTGITVNASDRALALYFDELRPAERFVATYKVIVKNIPVFGGTQLRSSWKAATEASTIAVSNDAVYEYGATDIGLAGSIVKTEEHPEIYVISQDATRRHIPSMDVYRSLYGDDMTGIKLLTEEALNRFPEGAPMRYKVGSMVQFEDNSMVYLVSDYDGAITPLTDEEVDQRIAKGEKVQVIAQDQFADYVR